MLEQEPHQEPDRGIVKPDDTLKIPWAPAVIPGAGIVSLKKHAAYIFHQEDASGVDKASAYDGSSLHMPHERGEERGTSIYGKHPQRRAAG